MKRAWALLLGIAGFALNGAASQPAAKQDGILTSLARFAVSSIEDGFTQRGERWYATCPYALGTYSFVELRGLKREVHAARLEDDERERGVLERIELTLVPREARFYWAAGKTWLDYHQTPKLRYFADRTAQGWTFEAQQRVCAHGEPQKRPASTEIPNG